MRKSLVALSTVAALGLFACQPNNNEQSKESAAKEEKAAEKDTTADMTESQKQAYAMGASMGIFVVNRGKQQEQAGLSMDKEALKQGFLDALNEKSKFTQGEIQQLAQANEQALRTKQQEMAAKAAEENVKIGADFLAENAKKEGVKVTDSGLQYEVITEGTGKSPEATDLVKVHYHGTLIDGTVFDSSIDRGEPVVFPLNRVIPGWTEGVQLMKEGAKFRFYIPSDLAYGERSTGLITPNSTLIFDVELLEVVDKEDAEKSE